MDEGVNAFTAAIAKAYDRHLGPALFKPYAANLARRVVALPPGPVLETACGTGILTRQLRLHLDHSIGIVATDLSQGMIDNARARLGTLREVRWERADASLLPFAADSFAAVVCQFGMMFVSDKAAAFREALRVLACGGVLAFSVWDGFAHNPWGRIAHETVRGFFPDNPPEFLKVAFGYHNRRDLRHSLRSHGFVDVKLDTVRQELCSPSARSLAVGQARGTPVCIALQQRRIAADQVVDALNAALEELGGRRPFRSTMQAILVTARKALR
jgi:ubiquinone/menaquinone biosynthesis C-methylase UbiE